MRWPSIIWALIGFTSICGGAPTGSEISTEIAQSEPTSTDTTTTSSSSLSSSSSSSPASLSSARRLPSLDVGLPSELAWQAWLVIANQPDAHSSFESATVPRRISPKSVFVAPELQVRCSDGYKSDPMGRCVKETIQINYKTHLEFILERLRAKFPSPVQLDDSAATGSEPKHSALSGPLQVNISLGIEDNLSASRVPLSSGMSEHEDDSTSDDSVEISVLQVPQNEASKSDRTPANKIEGDPTTYQVGNGTAMGEEKKTTFFRGNSSQPLGDHSIREVVVPVAEFLDDGNRTFTEVIDYEIPISLGPRFNTSNTQSLISQKNTTGVKNVNDPQPPTVVLLLSPTKLTGTADIPLIEAADSSLGLLTEDRILIGTNLTVIEEIRVNSTEASETTTLGFDDGVTSTHDAVEETTTSEVSDTAATTNYPEEDSEEATESNDEILAHGEAGMLVSAGKFTPSTDPGESHRVSSTSSKTGEENNGGSISSESSISGDVIVETTLLDLNTGATPTRQKFDHLREIFEAEKDLEPEVVFSPQDARRPDRLRMRGQKRAEDLAVSSAPAPKPSSFIFPTDFSGIDSIPEETARHTSRHKDEKGSYEGLPLGERSHLQQRRRTSSRNQDHVRFPDDPRRHSSSSYVLFPSADRSNSINGNLNYKERSSFAGSDNESPRPQSKPKSSVPFHQKKTHWHLPPGWRIEDLQAPRQSTVAMKNSGINQRQNPMLFRFWTRMPLFRDPSLTISNQSSRISPMSNPTSSHTVRGG